MSRTEGSFKISGALEPRIASALDARTIVQTKAELTASGNFPYPYIGMETYVVSEDKKYRLIGADPTVLANWKESGGGGGHEIVDSDDTALTQRDVLKFGEGFTVSDDDTNEQTVANINNMQSGDMDDIVHDLPPVTPIDLDEIVDPVPEVNVGDRQTWSTTTRVVGRFLNNKPVYQVTFEMTVSVDTNGTTKEVSYDVSGRNIESIVSISAVLQNTSQLPQILWTGSLCYITRVYHLAAQGQIRLASNRLDDNGKVARITLQYTSTTD